MDNAWKVAENERNRKCQKLNVLEKEIAQLKRLYTEQSKIGIQTEKEKDTIEYYIVEEELVRQSGLE